MDRTGKAIAEYHALPEESGRRRDLVASLGRSLDQRPDDEGVLDFLIAVAADHEDLDLARVEATKALRLWPPADPDLRRRAGSALRAALSHPDEDLVRQYAAMALAPYADDPGVHEALADAVLGDEDRLVRDNALAALSEAGPDERRAGVLHRLAEDTTLRHEALRILTAWGRAPAA
ncbi:HEAT repeat domain-containing protein [uncultured Streptomyces sp.]|uniref:HEAT repeat domain-containing protein n=1 Tax=uncultured Streptomyces sp. TaxID=174707 RepID=UPI0026361453|nr:HEAT repeat domain-containing protein [uncultured Streptomyces sp.]